MPGLFRRASFVKENVAGIRSFGDTIAREPLHGARIPGSTSGPAAGAGTSSSVRTLRARTRPGTLHEGETSGRALASVPTPHCHGPPAPQAAAHGHVGRTSTANSRARTRSSTGSSATLTGERSGMRANQRASERWKS